MPTISVSDVLERTSEYREVFGLIADPHKNPEEFIAAARQLNPRYKGDRTLVRFELKGTEPSFTLEQRGSIIMTAAALDMLKRETPLRGEFDVVVAHGGARRAAYDRLKYAAEALSSGQASGHLMAAGSTRPLRPGEAEEAVAFAPENAATEADLVAGAAAKVSEEFDIETGIITVDNPDAHTSDVLRAVIQRRGFESVRRVGGVATQIYWAKTDIIFRMMGRELGFTSAVAGNPSELSIVGDRNDNTYHTEILHTLNRAVAEIRQTRGL